ncbi:hypothetical protein MARHY1115 [Marinobacter nauticus ATCC 49840]|nr:hypothetical protein MARHY1115 [Marinobacter nauticus ATCC 49840]
MYSLFHQLQGYRISKHRNGPSSLCVISENLYHKLVILVYLDTNTVSWIHIAINNDSIFWEGHSAPVTHNAEVTGTGAPAEGTKSGKLLVSG